MKKILLIEDVKMYSQMTEDLLSRSGYQVEVVSKLPLSPEDPTFKALVDRANEFYCIVWDANIAFGEKDTIKTHEGFIQAFAEVFTRPMITFSSSDTHRILQLQAGCTHDLGFKDPVKLLNLLKTFPK